MLRAGIIGCGKIADAHAEQIQSIQGCEIVGVCDKEELMAKQLYERYKAKDYFKDVNEFLERCTPDIVHITSPPQSHFYLGKLCLEAGCNIYIEKPFTETSEEADELIRLANQKGRKITVGHNYQFTHVALRMRELVESGYLGGTPVHMESYYCYDIGDPTYAKALLGDNDYWVRKLPGKLLQNLISHGVCKIAEFLKGDYAITMVQGFTSSFLRNLGEADVIDELRVIIRDEQDSTAYFTFSSQMRPGLHQFRIYGPKNGLIVDDDQQTLIKVNGKKYKSYLETFLPPITYAKQYLSNWNSNVGRFLRNDFHLNSGMKYLIRAFYRSVAENGPLPIPYREIILTSRIMDSIFVQLK